MIIVDLLRKLEKYCLIMLVDVMVVLLVLTLVNPIFNFGLTPITNLLFVTCGGILVFVGSLGVIRDSIEERKLNEVKEKVKVLKCKLKERS